MPRVQFTPNLQRHVDCPALDVPGATVHEALEQYFGRHPKVRGYVLDERGAVRPHINVFVGGEPVRDREALSDAIGEADELYVMQALSGG